MKAKKGPIVGFRVSDEELLRIERLVEMVRERNPHMDKTKVLRELIGLDSAIFVTEADRRYLRSGIEPSQNGLHMVNRESLNSAIQQMGNYTQKAYDVMKEEEESQGRENRA